MKIRVRANRGGSKAYQLDLGMVDGKRKFLCFKTRGEAEEELTNAKQRKRREGTDALALSNADRVRFQAASVRLADSGATIEQAIEFYLKHHTGVKERLTVDVLRERFLLEKAASNKRPRYLDQLRCSTKSFTKAGHGSRQVHEITSDDVRNWMRGSGWAPKTQDGYLTDLRTMFGWAVDQRYGTVNPCIQVDPPALDDKPPEIFDVATCSTLLTAALDHDEKYQLLAYFAVALFAGIRPEEIGRLTWEQVHLDDKFIEVPARISKTRRRRIVAVSENMAEWLGRASRPDAGQLTPPNFGKRFRALRKLAKVTAWPHDVLRHCFASYHLAKHGSADQTATQLGHDDTQMLFQHYRELVRPRDALAFWELRPPARDDR